VASASKIRRYTADAQTDITIIRAIVFTSAAAADTVELKDGSSSGTVLITYRQPTVLATIGQTFEHGVTAPSGGSWYLELTGGAAEVTLIGD